MRKALLMLSFDDNTCGTFKSPNVSDKGLPRVEDVEHAIRSPSMPQQNYEAVKTDAVEALHSIKAGPCQISTVAIGGSHPRGDGVNGEFQASHQLSRKPGIPIAEDFGLLAAHILETVCRMERGLADPSSFGMHARRAEFQAVGKGRPLSNALNKAASRRRCSSDLSPNVLEGNAIQTSSRGTYLSPNVMDRPVKKTGKGVALAAITSLKTSAAL